jgi:hypothetical protein
MKIAYTMNGLVGGFEGKNQVVNSSEDSILILEYLSSILNDNIIKPNDIDIFLFSWHTNFEDQFNKFLSPKKMKLEPQIDFDIPYHLQTDTPWLNGRVKAHYSRWYGFKEVIKLVNEYEVENNFQYDLVVNSRFDVCWNRPFLFDKLDNNKFHIPMHPDILEYGWPDNTPEIIDHVFASNSENMKSYSSMFDNLDQYTLPEECPTWNLISSHFLMVWHLNKQGLLSEDYVVKSFTSWGSLPMVDQIRRVGSAQADLNIDYDLFRYRNLSKEKVRIELNG